MSRMPSKSFSCSVVSDAVSITLRRSSSRDGRSRLFVRCSEKDCQYVDVNKPPCPLTLSLFVAEIKDQMIADRK
ncbi:MAG TPA: hypothetical protein VL086_01030 [Candidatus Nitrosotalea sp.]|nr:hypothetical protein [Candidatus Nitrosotalea sp.]